MFSEKESFIILKSKLKKFPEILLTLGSGWNKALDEADIEAEISYKDLFGVDSTVPGHDGKLVITKFGKKRVACMAGRFHMYEGYTAREATLPIRVFAKAGAKKAIFTSASGALNEHYKVGDFVILTDLLTLFLSLDNPLLGPDFLDMSQVFSLELQKKAVEVCVKNKIPMHQGVYAYYHGPNYETPTDKMALRHLGADVVGMSTAPESIMTKSLKMEVLGISFVTNLAFVKHDHKDVVREANNASKFMVKLLYEVVEGL